MSRTFEHISDLPVGLRLDAAHIYAIAQDVPGDWFRVEAVGADWAVLRGDYDGYPPQLLLPGDIERYGGSRLVEYPCDCAECCYSRTD